MLYTKNKRIVLFDKQGINERYFVHGGVRDTDIFIKDHETGVVLFRTRNKVIIPGSGLIARKLFDVSTLNGSGTITEITPSYNTALSITTPTPLTTPITLTTGTRATESDPMIILFCVGIDGCGAENSQIYTVNYKKWTPPASLIPFRYPLLGADLDDTQRTVYFGRKEITVDTVTRVAYYFKKFDSAPALVEQYVDGTYVTSGVYDSANTNDAESYIEINLSVTKDDVREYFIATTGISSAKVNSLSLCSAWPVQSGDYIYYNDIRPFSKLNFANESLIDTTKGIDIVYHIYL